MNEERKRKEMEEIAKQNEIKIDQYKMTNKMLR